MKNCVAVQGQGTAPFGIPRVKFTGMLERSGHKTQTQRNRTGSINPGSTESVHRFISNAAGTLHGEERHSGTGGMIPSNQLSGRTSLRALAEKPESAARRIDLQN